MPPKLTTESVRSIVEGRGYRLLGDYANSTTHMALACPVGHEVGIAYANFRRGHGCKLCLNTRLTLTFDEVSERGRVLGLTLQPGSLNGGHRPAHWKCLAGHDSYNTPSSIQQGHGCPRCVNNRRAETELLEFVKSLCPDAIQNKTGILASTKLELDVFVPSLKKAVELDGEYWHNLSGAPQRDTRKDQECSAAGIQLLRVKYAAQWANTRKDRIGKPLIRQFLIGGRS